MAVSLVALLGMAALSIDVVTLYVARGEAQRAADAAALAGARMFATTSFATFSGSLTASEICASAGPGSSSAVNIVAENDRPENMISNQPATISNISCDGLGSRSQSAGQNHCHPQQLAELLFANVEFSQYFRKRDCDGRGLQRFRAKRCGGSDRGEALVSSELPYARVLPLCTGNISSVL